MVDGKELAARLVSAMDKGTKRIGSSALAKVCKVTPQAVNGWRSTGKIAKRHLPAIARATGKALSYFLEDAPDRQTNSQYTIEASALIEDYNALPDGLKEHLARKATELRKYVEALPPFLREGLKPPQEWEAYKQFERELETDMAKRLRTEEPSASSKEKRKI